MLGTRHFFTASEYATTANQSDLSSLLRVRSLGATPPTINVVFGSSPVVPANQSDDEVEKIPFENRAIPLSFDHKQFCSLGKPISLTYSASTNTLLLFNTNQTIKQ